MTDDPNESWRLREMRLRWESDPDSRVFLQLAEEYRRGGRAEEAVQVLEEGLERQGPSPAALVSLGRCRLELGDLDAACEVLEQVVAQDPAQLVANKLLLEVYLLRGEGERARKRLEVYTALQDRDPELEALTARVEALEAGERAAGNGAPAPSGDPFPGLRRPGDREILLDSLAAGGIFPVERPRKPRAATPLAGAEGAPEPELELELEAGAEPEVELGAGPPLEEDEGVREAPREEEAEEATVTLGELYLRQGHLAEAEEAFGRVLARDPGNEGARRGLARVRESLAGEEPPPPPARERKILALRSYLERIRRGAASR